MKKKIFYVFLACTIFVILIFSVYSKFKSFSKVQARTNIAQPIFEVLYNEITNINTLNENEYSYEFIVKNFKDENVSEVELGYDIEFKLSQSDAPITIKLYKENGEEIELVNNKTKDKQIVELGKKEEHYIAKISYNKNSNILMNNNLEISVNIKTVQESEENI